MSLKHYKYPKIRALGDDENKDIFEYVDDEIIVEEKIDGGNFSFFLSDDGKTVYECSRNRNLTTDEDEKTFGKQRAYLRKIIKDKELNPLYIYYCEAMARHTIAYETIPDIVALDIRLKHKAFEPDTEVGFFLNRDAKEIEFKRIGLEVVPLIWRGKARELRKIEVDTLIGKSAYYSGQSEGAVIKNYNRKSSVGNHQIFAKIVADCFKENNKAVFGSIKSANTDTIKIVDEFCTDARVRKMVLKHVNELNLPLDLKLMSKIPSAVIKDVVEEEFDGIFANYKFLDFKQMKQLVAKRCLRIIREEMAKRVAK